MQIRRELRRRHDGDAPSVSISTCSAVATEPETHLSCYVSGGETLAVYPVNKQQLVLAPSSKPKDQVSDFDRIENLSAKRHDTQILI